MEVSFQYLLPLVLLPLSLAAILLFRSKTRNHPPGTSGWPIIGENINFAVEGSHKFMSDRMKKYSPDVFKTSLMGEKMAIFCGPKGNKFIFTNENKLVTSWWPQSIKKTFLFDEYVGEAVVKETSAQNRRFTQDILKPEALKHFIPVMDAMAREHIEQEWAPNREVKVFPLSKKYTFDLACKILLSIEDPSQIKRLADPFHLMTNGMFSLPVDLPWTAYRGAIKGGKMVRAELLEIIRDRKMKLMDSEETEGRDLLSKMLLLKDSDGGQSFNEMEISNNIIGLLVASYDTTSSAITFVLKHLAEFPHIYDKVFQEQMAIAKAKGPDELLSWEDIEKMKYSWNVARESLRVTPAAQGSFREALTDFTYAGFIIPKGWKIFWNAYTTHKNPDYFPEPEKFDPTRFDGTGPVPYTFVPFGGGPHMCPGKEYARLEMLVFMYNVVTRFKMEKAIPNEKIACHASPTPMKGLPVRLQPHEQ